MKTWLQYGALILVKTFCLSLLLVSPAAAELSLDVPTSVSQGRPFVLLLKDSQPFAATVEWQGKSLLVEARQIDTPQSNASGAANARNTVGNAENSAVNTALAAINTSPWQAQLMLAVPQDAQGDLALTVSSTALSAPQSRLIAVKSVKWPTQELTVEPKYVTPPAEVLDKIARDNARTKAVMDNPSPDAQWTLPFFRPVNGTISNAFGGRRVFNGQPRSSHTGTDLRGVSGTPIHAVAAGRVALAEEQYYSGNLVLIDHGQGVVSMYAHMSAFGVKEGDIVSRGQEIGKVGATGRVTGAHLHLGLRILGVNVDAMPTFEPVLQSVGGPSKEVTKIPPAQPKKAPAKKESVKKESAKKEPAQPSADKGAPAVKNPAKNASVKP